MLPVRVREPASCSSPGSSAPACPRRSAAVPGTTPREQRQDDRPQRIDVGHAATASAAPAGAGRDRPAGPRRTRGRTRGPRPRPRTRSARAARPGPGPQRYPSAAKITGFAVPLGDCLRNARTGFELMCRVTPGVAPHLQRGADAAFSPAPTDGDRPMSTLARLPIDDVLPRWCGPPRGRRGGGRGAARARARRRACRARCWTPAGRDAPARSGCSSRAGCRRAWPPRASRRSWASASARRSATRSASTRRSAPHTRVRS